MPSCEPGCTHEYDMLTINYFPVFLSLPCMLYMCSVTLPKSSVTDQTRGSTDMKTTI